MSMNLTKLAKKLVQDSRNRKKNTDRSAGFHQNQLASIGVFYLLTSFCPASFLCSLFGQVLSKSFNHAIIRLVHRKKENIYDLVTNSRCIYRMVSESRDR